MRALLICKTDDAVDGAVIAVIAGLASNGVLL
jgi:hypothetical protein